MVTIKFIFDIASPNGYLCHKVIPDYEKKYAVKFDYEICLLGGIHKLSNNQPPMIANMDIPNKFNYFDVEIRRFVELHKLTKFCLNPHFPINTLTMQRGALVAQDEGFLIEYIDCIAAGMWEDKKNMGDTEILIDHLNKSGLDGKKILERTSDPKVKQKLIKNTEDAVNAGAFGVPTFYLHNQIFWGKEALREMPDYF